MTRPAKIRRRLGDDSPLPIKSPVSFEPGRATLSVKRRFWRAHWPELVVGGTAIAGFLFFLWWRGQGAKGDMVGLPPGATDTGPIGPGAPVLHRERAAGTDPRIQAALDAWEATGSFPICVGWMGGVRTNATQVQLFAQGRDAAGNVIDKSQVVTDAPTSSSSAHGHAGGIDLWPAWDGVAHPNRSTADEKYYYGIMVSFFEGQGLRSGKLFKIGGGDWPHFEVPDWRQLPLAA
jgi:hypothetical protein